MAIMIYIYNLNELQGMNTVLTEDYVLMNDIDASDTINWNGGKGFEPIGGSNWNKQFQGTFDGNGYKISNLYINRSNKTHQGLFGSIRSNYGFFVKNLGLENCIITGSDRTGGIVGNQIDLAGIIENCWVSGNITSSDWAAPGGIVGMNNGIIRNCYSIVNLDTGDGWDSNGGICAENDGTIENCYFAGNIISSGGRQHGICDGSGVVNNSFWDIELSGVNISDGGGTGKTTTEMKDIATYTDLTTTGLTTSWDFENNPNDDILNNDIWHIVPTNNEGYPIFSYEEHDPIGVTLNATIISYDSVTLNGELNDTGSYTVDLYFRYRKINDIWIEILIMSNINSPTTFSYPLTGLEPQTDYEYESIFKWDSEELFGNNITFTTTTALSPTVQTTQATNNTTGNSFTMNGKLLQLGSESSVNLFFEYKKQTNSTWIEVISDQNVSTFPYYFSEDITGLDEETYYEYRTIARWTGGEHIGNVISVFIESNPTIYFTKTGLELPDGNELSFGDIDNDGSWRIIKIGTDLIIQIKQNGVWVNKHIF
jgi:hypothetical protein